MPFFCLTAVLFCVSLFFSLFFVVEVRKILIRNNWKKWVLVLLPFERYWLAVNGIKMEWKKIIQKNSNSLSMSDLKSRPFPTTYSHIPDHMRLKLKKVKHLNGIIQFNSIPFGGKYGGWERLRNVSTTLEWFLTKFVDHCRSRTAIKLLKKSEVFVGVLER